MYQIQGDTIILSNGESYTFHELQFLRWDRNNWKRIAEANDRDLEKSKNKDAVVFSMDELILIRDVLRLLDDKLPGYRLQEQIKDAFLPRRRG